MSYQLLTQIMIPLLCYAQGRLSILVLQTRVGSGPQEQPHALALVLNDAVVQGRVALPRLLVQRARVLDDEVDDVEGVACLVGNRVVKTSFGKFLKNWQKILEIAFGKGVHC